MPPRLRSGLLALSACLGLMACEGSKLEATPTPTEATLPPASPQAPNPSLSPEGQPLEAPLSCREERGLEQAQALVKRCIAVSPATRPPCNVANPCALIEAEIKRGCDFFGPDEKPAQCAA